MRNKISIFTLLVLMLVLTACKRSPGLSMEYENALPIHMQLLIGIFNLDDTDDSIEAEQAVELIPLWKNASEILSNPEHFERSEMAALFKQIQAILTNSQIKEIAAMRLTPDDLLASMDELGMEGKLLPSANEGPSNQQKLDPSLDKIIIDLMIEFLETKIGQ